METDLGAARTTDMNSNAACTTAAVSVLVGRLEQKTVEVCELRARVTAAEQRAANAEAENTRLRAHISELTGNGTGESAGSAEVVGGDVKVSKPMLDDMPTHKNDGVKNLESGNALGEIPEDVVEALRRENAKLKSVVEQTQRNFTELQAEVQKLADRVGEGIRDGEKAAGYPGTGNVSEKQSSHVDRSLQVNEGLQKLVTKQGD